MAARDILSAVAGIVFLCGFVPYIIAIVRKETQPSKASWIIWATLDSVTLAGMYFKGTLNGQIIGAVTGAVIVVFLALKYGTPGWTKLDKQCLAGGLVGIVLWMVFDEPNFGIILSNLVVFLGSLPTFASAWKNPLNENRTAWTIFWISCVLAALTIPAWTIADAVQPMTFLAVESVMMYILYFRKQPVIA